MLGYATRLTNRWDLSHRLAQAGLPPEDAFVGETQLLAQRQWPRLTAQIHREPACVGPVLIQPKLQTELVVQLAGNLQFDVTRSGARRRYTTEPGSVFLTAADKPAYEIEWFNVSPEPVRTIHLYLDNTLLAHTAAESGLNAAQLELQGGSCLPDPLLRQLGLTLAQELDSSLAPSDLYADTVAQLLAVHLVRHHSAHRPATPTRQGSLLPARLRQVQEYIQAHLGQPITLAELAAVACLSAYHFCRVFRHSTGLSPNQYVIQQRLERARRLLCGGQLSVAQVATEVGYQNPSHFAQLFHRHIGCAPADYRTLGGS
jgi:AraC family transcriptional regulator